MTPKVYLAIDVGAESGRVMAGIWNGTRLDLREIHRFPNGPISIANTLRWDILRIWQEIQIGLSLAAKQFGDRIVSVGADTWAVDFVLLDRHNEILGLPYHYRDSRTRGMMAKAFCKVPRQQIFAQSGIQFMEINTLYQLLAWKEQSPEILESAKTMLFIPDFIHWCLCGSKSVEFTNASTSQFVHPLRHNWSKSLLKKLGLRTHFLPKIVQPGTVLGKIMPSVAEIAGLHGVKVIAPPTHDTASAVAGVPTSDSGKQNWAYISSGTWSLMGVERKRPILSARALELNFTNEGGLDGTYRILKNIAGLWLVQQCNRSFAAAGRKCGYHQLAKLAAGAKRIESIVDVNSPEFVSPPDMPSAIQDHCRRTKQAIPRTDGEIVRCAYRSLAAKYREVLASLEELTGNQITTIHIVGGGSQSALLNQMTADACHRTIIAGPAEATSMGNLLTQIRASGELGSLAEMRQIVRESSSVRYYEPRS